MAPEPVLRRHKDRDPALICRPALGYGLCEVLEPEGGERGVEIIPCADAPYRCDGFDPADWPPGEIPDFSPFREWERRAAGDGGSETAATREAG